MIIIQILRNLFFVDLLPLNKISQSETIRKLLSKVHSITVPKKFQSIFESARMVEDRMVNRIKSKLAEQTPALCADEWTSRSRKRFLNIQAFIGGKKCSLGVMKITARATGVELLKMTQVHMHRWGSKHGRLHLGVRDRAA